MGWEPTAAARWMAYWPLLSRMRVEALCSMSRRATSRFFLEATKCSAEAPLLSGGVQGQRGCVLLSVMGEALTLLVDVGAALEEQLEDRLAVGDAGCYHEGRPSAAVLRGSVSSWPAMHAWCTYLKVWVEAALVG